MDNQSKTMYHSGHRELQKRFDGVELADALEQMNNQLTFQPKDKEFIENVNFFFLRLHSKKVLIAHLRVG